MSNRLFSQVCPVIRGAPSRRRRRRHRLLLALVLMAVLPLFVCLGWHVGMRIADCGLRNGETENNQLVRP